MTGSGNRRPVVLVIGATGRQGGSVARHLLAGDRWSVRALTRRPRTDEAMTLAALGAEVVPGDLDDLRSLRAAMQGAQAVFGVTDWWEHFDREEAQGRAIVDAAVAERVAHLVLSTQPSVAAVPGALAHAGPFEPKAAVERYARSRGAPATFVHVAFYWENLLSMVLPRALGGGRHELTLPMGSARLAGIAEDEIGGVVAAILAAGPAMRGRTIALAGDARRADEIAAGIARVTGRCVSVDADPTHSPWARIPGAEALAVALDGTFAAYRGMQDGLDEAVAATRALYAGTRDLECWLDANASELRYLLARGSTSLKAEG